MSTLRVNTIQNSGGTGSPAINGLAAAWVNFNGTGTVSIRASNNVSSITDNGTGDYTVNFTTAFSDANYCVTQGSQMTQAGSMSGYYGSSSLEIARQTNALTTTSARFWATYSVDQNFYDRTMVCLDFFR
jgi:hypothetical protein